MTSDNRDFCGIGEACGTTFYILVDGATSCLNGGGLAKALVVHLLNSFLNLGQPLSNEKVSRTT